MSSWPSKSDHSLDDLSAYAGWTHINMHKSCWVYSRFFERERLHRLELEYKPWKVIVYLAWHLPKTHINQYRAQMQIWPSNASLTRKSLEKITPSMSWMCESLSFGSAVWNCWRHHPIVVSALHDTCTFTPVSSRTQPKIRNRWFAGGGDAAIAGDGDGFSGRRRGRRNLVSPLEFHCSL